MLCKTEPLFAKKFINDFVMGNKRVGAFYYKDENGFTVVDSRAGQLFMRCFDTEIGAICYDYKRDKLELIIDELQKLYVSQIKAC